MKLPVIIPNWINGEEKTAAAGGQFVKLNPATGEFFCHVTRSQAADVAEAVRVAKTAQEAWRDTPAVQRGMILHRVVMGLQEHAREMAALVAGETGKTFQEALGETGGAVQLGLFYAGEGQRLYGRTTTSGTANKYAMTVRQPLGVAGLIIAANTPIANVAWKVFPALICGNSAVLKAAEDTPATAWLFGRIAHEAGLPPGVLNVVQGYGREAGEPLVANPLVDVVSFTGSTAVGRQIQRITTERFARLSLELGGKNPLVVCDDADLENAVKWTLLSAFSNAGQRCASGSRILVFDAIYEKFRHMLVEKTAQLKVGPDDGDDLGPVINQKQLDNMLAVVAGAVKEGGVVHIGGHRLTSAEHAKGFYMAPTVIDHVDPQAAISLTELFGPVATLYRVADIREALALANNHPYGLTASIHTSSFHRAIWFCDRIQAGVAIVNAGTYGSEPHMPFGGMRQSGNGSREPGTEALDVYSELKDIYLNIDMKKI